MLPVAGYSLEARRVTKGGLAAVQAVVRQLAEERPTPRALADVTDVIDKSSLPLADRERGIAVFRRLGEAEAAVDG